MRYTFALAIFCVAIPGCARTAPDRARTEPADARVKAIADRYLEAVLERNPEMATLYGIPGRRHDKLTDNSLAAVRAWEGREDAFLAELTAIDRASIAAAPLRATYAIMRHALDGAVAKRVCRDELWPANQMTGWQVGLGYLVTIQPVGSEEARADALARWGALPKVIDTEIENLREGLREGYSSPKLVVRIVLDQVRALAATPLRESPFGSPVQRDGTPAFRRAFTDLVLNQITPAMKRYADFLEKEYLPAARDAIAVATHPNGSRCYDASVLYFSSVPKTAAEVHALGVQQNERLMEEMKTIGQRAFQIDDVPQLLRYVRTDPKFKFRSREEKIAYSQAALARAKAAMPSWFGLTPRADVVIQPYPRYREKNAPGEYNAPAEDGSRPAVFLISAYQAERQSRVEDESTAFHETIPGHHLQGAIALERKDIHPIGRYLFNSGYVEGWGLYAERLADEMHLFSSDLDRLGMLSSQALRASRLVVDSGLHTVGWSRQQAIDYMVAHVPESRTALESEVDRYIADPGQATAYMIGRLEIERLRHEAEHRLGKSFDIREFHDRVLENGSVPLSFLSSHIEAWLNSTGGSSSATR